ncbi:plectin-like isoform X1 [Rhizophagus irregularis DAOM 181602=DAOM 197198]|nr:plectin-like isoform X1 [Rhizophagus irregularis DAOM 181602=DAOM 197198]
MVVIGNKKNKKTRNRLPQKKRRQWNVREKLMIVHYYENNNRNIRGTTKRFDIQPKQLHDWKNKKGTLLTTAPHVAKLHPAISLSKSPELLANNPGIAGFKFSNKWLEGFLGRYDLSERRRTTVAQQLPSDLIEKQNIF